MLVVVVPYALAVVVAAAVATATLGSRDWLIWVGALMAGTGVLMVEPWVCRRWYREPL